MAFLPEVLRPSYVVLFVSVCIAYHIVYRQVLWPRYFSPLRGVPTPPGAYPFIGHAHIIINSEAGIPQREWVKQLGPVIRLFGPLGRERLLFVQAQHLHQILVKDWLDYPRPSYMRHILGIVSGYGLLTVTGNDHRLMRKAMNPAFSLANLTSQMQMYHKIPVYDWISKATLDIICSTAFGYKADSLHNPHDELAEAYHNLTNLQNGPNLAKLAPLMLIPGMPKLLSSSWLYTHRRWLNYSSFFGYLVVLIESMHTIKQVSARLLQEKMNDSVAVSDGKAKNDIMSILVRARKADLELDDGAYAISDKAMVDQVLPFLSAGHDTTAAGLTWALWLLAKDQESQRRLREEVTPVLKEKPHPDYRTLKELQWLDCVIMESLRLMPAVPHTVRIANKTDYIGDILVPKGTTIYIPIRVVNTYNGIWGEDAEEFKPSRWLEPPKDYSPNYSLLSFIAGPHGCIGKTMAIMEMKAVLSALIANFTFEPAHDGQVANPATAITMKPADGMPLLVKRVR